MKPEVTASLEEIEAAQDILVNGPESSASHCRSWIRNHKEYLKTLGYTGKFPRKQRSDKKGDDEQEESKSPDEG